ncbi:hypothetical protein BD770DRAFT_294199, partial [Pilaira anomala]
MQFFYEDGTRNITDARGQEAPAFVEEPSFRLKSLTDLRKCIKNRDVQVEFPTATNDVVMEEVSSKKERVVQYNVYTFEDRKRYFYF